MYLLQDFESWLDNIYVKALSTYHIEELFWAGTRVNEALTHYGQVRVHDWGLVDVKDKLWILENVNPEP